MSESGLVFYEKDGEVAVLTIDNPPVNALGQKVRAGLLACLARAQNDADIKAILLIGNGRAFIAGADIKEFGKPLQEPYLPDVCAAIAGSSVLVVVALHGVTLGGGLEVSLAADYRIAQNTAQVGFPEVRLGLIPGAGGTQRLPRRVGTASAIDLIASGRQIGAPEACALGLVDLIYEGAPKAAGLAYVRELLGSGAPRGAQRAPVPSCPIDWAKQRTRVADAAPGQIAPVHALKAIRASTELSFEDGLRAERQIFLNLMQGEQRKALTHAFFSERRVGDLSNLKGAMPREISQIAVIGGGTMGTGIATAALMAGIPTILLETTEAAALSAQDRVIGQLEGALRRKKLTAREFDNATKHLLEITTDYDRLSNTDLVIEAVFEDLAVKQSVFRKLDRICRCDTILATNTSYLDINLIASATGRPKDVIGLHFFSPAHVMKLLEIVVPEATDAEIVATGFALAKRLGKTGVRAGVCDGFIGNRIMNAYRTACDHMVLAGATPAQIDAALTEFGFAMGPYAVADLAGLDIGWANRKRHAGQRDARKNYVRFPDDLCEAGHFGQKTGSGYYAYSKGKQAIIPNKVALDLIEAEQKERGIHVQDFTSEQIVRRFMAATVNEAARVVGSGIAQRPLDVDVVLIKGYGFPRFRGGPCKWADLTGLKGVVRDIEALEQQEGHFWTLAPLLHELDRSGRLFEDLNAG